MNKKALVTGAGGFIGSHLVEGLLLRGWKVRAIVRYNSRSSWGWLENARNRHDNALEVVLGDVADPYQMRQAVSGCEVIFHLAALIGIPYSYVAPASYVSTNINGTLNLLQAARDLGIARFIHTSTSEVYGTALFTPIDENHPLQAQSPYSASKIAADKMVESFYCTYGLPTVVVRPFNTYGPRQSTRAVIPTIITQALRGSEIHLGALTPVRDLTFVEDTVAGFIAASDAENAVGRVINLGTGKAVSIGELVQIILGILGEQRTVVTKEERLRPPKSEVMELISDNALAMQVLAWQPQIDLNEGLRRTIAWVRENQGVYSQSGYTL